MSDTTIQDLATDIGSVADAVDAGNSALREIAELTRRNGFHLEDIANGDEPGTARARYEIEVEIPRAVDAEEAERREPLLLRQATRGRREKALLAQIHAIATKRGYHLAANDAERAVDAQISRLYDDLESMESRHEAERLADEAAYAEADRKLAQESAARIVDLEAKLAGLNAAHAARQRQNAASALAEGFGAAIGRCA